MDITPFALFTKPPPSHSIICRNLPAFNFHLASSLLSIGRLTISRSTLQNTVGGVTRTVGYVPPVTNHLLSPFDFHVTSDQTNMIAPSGVTGALGRGLGDTITGATGSAGKPVGDGLSNTLTGLENGANKVARGVEDAGQWKSGAKRF
jgi:hypothetical protein